MAIKLISAALDGIQVELPKNTPVDTSEEGLWNRIKDSISYMFTSDSSVAEKIGNMCYWLEHMDEDQVKELEATRMDGKFQSYTNMNKIMAFSGAAVDFCATNLGKYEGTMYVLDNAKRAEISKEMETACAAFEASHDRNEIATMIQESGDKGQEDPTYVSLGYNHAHLTEIAKKYKNDQAGRLGKIRKLKFIMNVTAYDIKNGKSIIANIAARNFGVILNDAIKSYKYVNKFLFVTYREMQRQKIITH